MQTRATAAMVALLVLLSGAALAMPAQDGDALTADPTIGDIKELIAQDGDAGFSLQMDGDAVLRVLKMLSDMDIGSVGDVDDDDFWEYLERTDRPTMEGLLNAMGDGTWRTADFDGAVAATVSSSGTSDGRLYRISASLTVGGAFSMTPEDAPASASADGSVRATVGIRADVRTDSDLVFRSASASMDYYVSSEMSRNFVEIDDDEYRIVDRASDSLVYAGSADAMVEIDALTMADMDAIMAGSDDIVKHMTVAARVVDGSGAFAGVEKRATMELDDLKDIFEDIPSVGDLDDILDDLFGGSASAMSATTTGADVGSIEWILSKIFGDSLDYYCDFPGLETNLDSKDLVRSRLSGVPDREVSLVAGTDGDYSMTYWKSVSDSRAYVTYAGAGTAPSQIMGVPTQKVLGVEDVVLPDGGTSSTVSFPDGSRTVTVVSHQGSSTVTTVTSYGPDGAVRGTVRMTAEVTVGSSGSATITTVTERFGPDGATIGTSTTVSIEVGYDSASPLLDGSSVKDAMGRMDSAEGTITVEPSKGSSSGFGLTISGDAFDAAAGKDILIQGPAGSIRISGGSFDDAQKAGGVTLSLTRADVGSMNAAQQKAAAGMTVYDIGAVSGSSIHRLAGSVTVTLPYASVDGLPGSEVSVFYMDDAGELHQMDTVYDEGSNTLSFETDHFSYFAIAKAVAEDGESDDTMFFLAVAVLAIIVIAAAVVLAKRSRGSA